MNVNKICAAVSALCFAGSAAMLAMNKQSNNRTSAVEELLGDVNRNGVVDAVDASTILAYYAYVSAGHDGTTLEQFITMRSESASPVTTQTSTYSTAMQPTQTTSVYTAYPTTTAQPTTLRRPYTTDKTTQTKTQTTTAATTHEPAAIPKPTNGGDTFTIAVWNADDYPRMVDTWLKKEPVEDYDVDYSKFKTPSGAKINVINFGTGGAEAPEYLNKLFLSGDDIDVYFCEADWMKRYIDDDSRSAPLSALGFTEEDFSQSYKYADEIGHDANGVRKAVAPQIAPGGFAYRTDFAKQYLGIDTPSEMQEAIGSWDKFIATAKKISDAANGEVALADTVGGLYHAFSTQHNMIDRTSSGLKVTSEADTFAGIAKALWDCGGVTKNSQWTDEWTADTLKGKVMGYFVPTWGTDGFLANGAGLHETGSANSEGKWALVNGPEKFCWGGIWTVVNPATDNADDCASFIRSSCLDKDDMLKTAKRDKRYLPNNKAAVADIINDPSLSGMSGCSVFANNDYLKVFADTAENIDPAPMLYNRQMTDNDKFCMVLLDNYLRKGKDLKEVYEYFEAIYY